MTQAQQDNTRSLTVQEVQILGGCNPHLIIRALFTRPALMEVAQREGLKPEWLFASADAYRAMLYVADVAQRNGQPVSFHPVLVQALTDQDPAFRTLFSRVQATWQRETGYALEYPTLLAEGQIRPLPLADNEFAGFIGVQREIVARWYLYQFTHQLANTVASAPWQALLDATEQHGIIVNKARNLVARVQPPMSMGDAAALAVVDAAVPKLHAPAFPIFSHRLGGFRAGSLTILAGRAKAGKSTLLTRLSLDWALAGTPVLYLDSEMSQKEVAERQLSMLTGLPMSMATSPDCAGTFTTAVNRLRDMTAFTYGRIAGWTVEQVLSRIREFRRANPGGIIVVDWLKTPAGTNLNRVAEWQFLGAYASALKDVAEEVGLPIIAAVQQNAQAIGATHEAHVAEGERFTAGADKLNAFATAMCAIRPVSPAMKDAVAQQFGVDTATGLPKCNTILQVTLNRFGESRTMTPLLFDGRAMQINEVADPAAQDLVDNFTTPAKRAGRSGKMPAALGIGSTTDAPAQPAAGASIQQTA